MKSQVITIDEGLAHAILDIRANHDADFANDYWVMAKGYNEDYDNYTELCPEDADNTLDGEYTDYELWLTDVARIAQEAK